MFWKWGSKDDDTETHEAKHEVMEIPPLEELENWVIALVVKLQLEPGNFTFLPAYGGVLLFIKSEGLAWIPYNEIKDALGELQKNKLVENTATIGGVAAIAATGTSVLPAILVHRLLKGSYRIFAQPSPGKSMSILKSMIDKVIIEEKPLSENLLNTFEEVPYKEKEGEIFSTAVLTIKRKFIDTNSDTNTTKIMRGVKTFFLGSSDPIFAIPPQSDVKKFATILRSHGIEVETKRTEQIEGKTTDYQIEDVNENQ